MEIKLSYSVVKSQLSVRITEDGRHLKTLLLPLPSGDEDFEALDGEFDVEFSPDEYGAVLGLVLPPGYFAIGVYVGKFLKRILLSGPGLSCVVNSVREAHDEISAHEEVLRQQHATSSGPK